jgi:spermidine synthase
LLPSGLGIGTTPAALIQHGIDTTIVEIDQIVYNFALQYFQFPQNHTAVIDNAVTFVETAKRQSQQYDYIVHDVFTGGVEPVELFTLEFIQGLYALLKYDGIVAIVRCSLFPLIASRSLISEKELCR